ncbi:MAG TPA: zinc-dependent metalloprotease [Actinomycetota bacterium]|nr:zinc-dependent metalloprotease [Actinomycetota bacterium]
MTKLIEPWIALATARRFTGDGGISDSYLLERLRRDLDSAVPRAEDLVAEASGIARPGPVRWELIGRQRWVEANVRSMTTLMGPLADRVARRLDAVPWPARVAQRTAVSAEVGVLLGYVSRRVLGQYDLLVPEDDEGAASLYFVGPNLVETERRFGFIPEEFTLWVAVHEVTHRFQFEGVPWLRPHFLDLVHRYLGSMDMDVKSLTKRLGEAARKLMSRAVPVEERNPIYLLASAEQRALLDQIQALMAVVEGHGNFVMDTVGAAVIPSFKQMRHVFQRRRSQATFVQKALNHAIGLEMKLRQYELGQQFCESVVQRQGHPALARLWDSPDRFPTMAELRTPELWLDRVAA